MLAFTLDRSKKWRLPEWKTGLYIEFLEGRWCYKSTTRLLLDESAITSDKWEEYQPEPQLEWRASGDGDTYRLMNKGIAYGRPATEAELRSIRRSLGIKE